MLTMRSSVLVLASLVLGACASSPDSSTAYNDPVPEQDWTQESQSAAMETQGQEFNSAAEARALAEADRAANDLLSITRLHFDFDASRVRDEYQKVLEAHARYLIDNPGQVLNLQGHADERGTREYNMALGERRAMNVEKALLILGARPEQLRSVSYGEEQPLVEGQDRESFQQNRRVELDYQGPTSVSAKY